MKFKDRLKALRTERGLTQKELGEAIFVSRSAIAKWENGLGLPSSDSYEALVCFFETDAESFPLNEAEEITDIKKRVRRRLILNSVSWILILCLAAAPFLLLWAVERGYGFTSKMAAGKIWENDEVISTEDYDFYYYANIYIKDENGETDDRVIAGFCVIEKRLYGYQKLNIENFKKTVYTKDEEIYGYLYSFPAKNCHYNFFVSQKTLRFDNELGSVIDINLLSEIDVGAETAKVALNSYFVTSGRVNEFFANEQILSVR